MKPGKHLMTHAAVARARRANVPDTGTWYALSGDRVRAELLIYEDIGMFGVEASVLVAELLEMDRAGMTDLTVRINSRGGSVFDGLAIYQVLRDIKASVEVHVDGLAASIASIIAMAGDRIVMAPASFMMIHNAWTIAIGNADEMRQLADVLDQFDEQLVGVYQRRTGVSQETIEEWMAAETWLNAEMALEHGFADAIAGDEEPEEDDAAAAFDLTIYNNVPGELRHARRAPGNQKRRAEAALREAGFSRREAKAIVADGLRDAPPRDAGDGDRRDADYSTALADAIRSLTASLA